MDHISLFQENSALLGKTVPELIETRTGFGVLWTDFGKPGKAGFREFPLLALSDERRRQQISQGA